MYIIIYNIVPAVLGIFIVALSRSDFFCRSCEYVLSRKVSDYFLSRMLYLMSGFYMCHIFFNYCNKITDFFVQKVLHV